MGGNCHLLRGDIQSSYKENPWMVERYIHVHGVGTYDNPLITPKAQSMAVVNCHSHKHQFQTTKFNSIKIDSDSKFDC